MEEEEVIELENLGNDRQRHKMQLRGTYSYNKVEEWAMDSLVLV